MKNKIIVALSLSLVLCFSFVSADFQSLQELRYKKERIKIIKESVSYLILFSEIRGGDQSVIATLKNMKVMAENIEEQVEKKIENKMRNFVECLKEEDLIIYGFEGSSPSDDLMDQFGDYDFLDLIYVECSDEGERCLKEMKNFYVPEVQIKGEIYQGEEKIESLGNATKCLD